MRLESRELAKRAIEQEWQRAGATISITIQGNSMGSTLPAGTVVLVQFSKKPRPKRGDIIYFRKGPLRVAHRLLARLGPFCIEKGDANNYIGVCRYSDILGIVKTQ